MCDKNISIDINNNYSFWENHNTSRDEKEIIDYLQQNLNIIKNKKILHIGIGNSELGLIFYKEAKYIDGITISGLEKKNAIKNKCYRNVYICNKYNINDMKIKVIDDYDIIIDQGLKQYTCCQKHFEDLFKFYIEKINIQGFLITSKLGMNWSGYPLHLRLKKKLINDDTNLDKSNILTNNELIILNKKYNLNFSNPINNIIMLFN